MSDVHSYHDLMRARRPSNSLALRCTIAGVLRAMISEVGVYSTGRTTDDFDALGLECSLDGVCCPAPESTESIQVPQNQTAGESDTERDGGPESGLEAQPAAEPGAVQDDEPSAQPELEPAAELGQGDELAAQPQAEPASIAPAPDPELETNCEDGFWRAAEEDECVAWTPCGPDLPVSVAGSDTSDQVCGVRLVAVTIVPEAVDLEQFSAHMAVASGAASMVTIVITSFEQTVTSATNVPGSVADYQSDAAQTQFRFGVALALEVDLSAISGLTVTDARRRQRRQLQDSTVTISYAVVLTDPTVAMAVATATKDTDAFTTALVQAVNDVGGGGLSLDVSSVTVELPTISTAIEYDIVIQTADVTAVSGVQERMQDTSVIALALSAATGTTISQGEVSSTVVQPDAVNGGETDRHNVTSSGPTQSRDSGPVVLMLAAATTVTMILSAAFLMKKIEHEVSEVNNWAQLSSTSGSF